MTTGDRSPPGFDSYTGEALRTCIEHAQIDLRLSKAIPNGLDRSSLFLRPRWPSTRGV